MPDALRRVYVLPAGMVAALRAEASVAGEPEVVVARRLLRESLDQRETVEALATRAARMVVESGLAATLTEIVAHPLIADFKRQPGKALITCVDGDVFELEEAARA